MKAARRAAAFGSGLIMAIGVAGPTPGGAAEPASAKPGFADIAAEASKQIDSAPGGAGPSGLVRDADMKDYADYLKWQRGFARQSWSWHLFSTKLLMYVVLAIVGFGLLLTYMQFTRDARRRPRRAKTSLGPDDPPSTLKVGPTGVEVTSQVIGLLVMGFSLAFFYLYVKVVYPMQEVELQRHAQAVVDTMHDKGADDEPRPAHEPR